MAILALYNLCTAPNISLIIYRLLLHICGVYDMVTLLHRSFNFLSVLVLLLVSGTSLVHCCHQVWKRHAAICSSAFVIVNGLLIGSTASLRQQASDSLLRRIKHRLHLRLATTEERDWDSIKAECRLSDIALLLLLLALWIGVVFVSTTWSQPSPAVQTNVHANTKPYRIVKLIAHSD